MRNNLSNILFFLKGFTLPTSNTTSNGSFSNLITQTSANANTIVQAPLMFVRGANTIVQAPLMFVRGGGVLPGYNLDGAGNYGTYWSSVSFNSYGAYSLYFDSGFVNPSFGNYRYYGQSVRCVALGG